MINKIIGKAKELGFIGIGFSHPGKPIYFDEFKKWIAARKNAEMRWLERNVEIRENPQLILKQCNTIISLAYPYSSLKPATGDGLTVSRYSEPDKEDYHIRVRSACNEIIKTITSVHKGSSTRICVDSAPILERSFAVSSGIGFVGKNNMLIIPGYGSYFYLSEILTSAPLGFSQPNPVENMCGSCTKCIDSCPAGALDKPFLLDASKCLSYLTIEYKGYCNSEDGTKMGNCFFGCDRCQEVCPLNKRGAGINISLPSADEFLVMDNKYFLKKYGKTSFKRAGLKKIQSNIKAVLS